jgi:hypothetical protein
MPEIRLDRARVVAVVGELVAAGMAQHMGMCLDAQIGKGRPQKAFQGETLWRATMQSSTYFVRCHGSVAYNLPAKETASFAQRLRV